MVESTWLHMHGCVCMSLQLTGGLSTTNFSTTSPTQQSPAGLCATPASDMHSAQQHLLQPRKHALAAGIYMWLKGVDACAFSQVESILLGVPGGPACRQRQPGVCYLCLHRLGARRHHWLCTPGRQSLQPGDHVGPLYGPLNGLNILFPEPGPGPCVRGRKVCAAEKLRRIQPDLDGGVWRPVSRAAHANARCPTDWPFYTLVPTRALSYICTSIHPCILPFLINP
eukprot:364905-Chlamydomonas_euryale.AAC.24